MDGWVGGWMDGWVDGWLLRHTFRYVCADPHLKPFKIRVPLQLTSLFFSKRHSERKPIIYCDFTNYPCLQSM